MTQQEITEDLIAQFASQMARSPHTLAVARELMDDAERRQEISTRIARLRKRRGLTQPQVAERMGMASKLRTYQNWEAGGGTSHENYERLAEILGVSYDYLVSGAEAAPPADDILARLDELTERVAESEALARVEKKVEQLLANQTKLLATVDRAIEAQASSRRSRGSKKQGQ